MFICKEDNRRRSWATSRLSDAADGHLDKSLLGVIY